MRLQGTTEEEGRAGGRVGWGSPDSRTFPLLYNPRRLQVVPIFPQA